MPPPPLHETPPAEDRPAAATGRNSVLKLSIFGIFMILFTGTLYYAQGFVLPVLLAFLFALILSPVVRVLNRRGVPKALSAPMIVLAMACGLVGATWSLSGPVSEMIDDAPNIGYELRRKLRSLGEPIEAVKKAQKSIEDATNKEPEPGVQEVVMREPGLVNRAVSGAPEILVGIGLTLVLLVFLLASGDRFYRQLIHSMPTLEDKKRWVRTFHDVEREVSRYLFTVSFINVTLGVCIAGGLYAAGAPDPLLWGVAAALLNFVPYLGALVGIAALTIMSIVSFPTLSEAAIPPLIYATFTFLEGQFVTPAVMGRRLQINPVIVFMAIAFWGWLWGVIGVLIAVPILIIIKIFARHAEGLDQLADFLSDEPMNGNGDGDDGNGKAQENKAPDEKGAGPKAAAAP